MKTDELQPNVLRKDDIQSENPQKKQLKLKKVLDEGQQVCRFKNKGVFYCTDQECQSHAIYCNDQQCECNKSHQHCKSAFKVNALHNILQSKLQASDLVSVVDHIRYEMQEILCKLQQNIEQQMDLFGLNYAERNFQTQLLNDLKQMDKDISDKDKRFTVRGSFMNIFLKKSKLSKEQQENEQMKRLMNIVDSFHKQIDGKFEEIWKNIRMECKRDIVTEVFLQSSILRSQREVEKIIQLTEELKYHQPQLIFKGSVDGMSVEQFHSKCDNKPNLLYLVENEFGFKYGGYCPCPISIDRLGEFEKDESVSSFVFSLDLNKKADLLIKQYAIRNGGYQDTQQQALIGFGRPEYCNLVIGANSIEQQSINWIDFHQLYSESSYTTQQFPPSAVQTCGTQLSICRLREVEVYQITS